MDLKPITTTKTKKGRKESNCTDARARQGQPIISLEEGKEIDLLEDETIFDINPAKKGSAGSRLPQNAKSETTAIVSHAVSSENWETAENNLRDQLNAIRDNLAEITAQSSTQKNVGRVITQRVQKINEAVDIAIYELQQMKRLRKKEEEKIRNSTGKRMETPLRNRNGDSQIPSPDNVPLVTQKRDETITWAVVTSRRKRARNDGEAMRVSKRIETAVRESVRPNPRHRKGAVLVKPTEGKTYAEIVRNMKAKMEGSRFKDKVHTIRKTKDGSVLVQLEREEDRPEFQKALQDVIGQTGRIKDLTSKIPLEFLDLDCETTADEIKDAINYVLGGETHRDVHVFGENSRGQILAVCEFTGYEATKLLEKGRIKIGWVNCRVRQRIRVQRCHRCLGYGHLKADCKGPDRHDCCWRCGKKGHVGKECKNSPACFLCVNSDNRHLPGTGSCAAFRAALAEIKKKRPKCP